VHQAISSTYSSYIHAAAPQVMDMYRGDPPNLHIKGVLSTSRMSDHVDDSLNYYFEAVTAPICVARAFGNGQLPHVLDIYHDKFLA